MKGESEKLTIHHLGIIVKDIDKNIDFYEKLGYTCSSELIVDTIQKNNIIFLKSPDKMQELELIEPLNQDSSTYNFKPSYHHICYDVSNIPDFQEYFNKLRIGKIFSKRIVAPALNGREIVFALLNNGLFVEFILSR